MNTNCTQRACAIRYGPQGRDGALSTLMLIVKSQQ